jgi:hypothetical protein
MNNNVYTEKPIYKHYATRGGRYRFIVFIEPSNNYSYTVYVNDRSRGGGSGFTANTVDAIIAGILHNSALDGIHYEEVQL